MVEILARNGALQPLSVQTETMFSGGMVLALARLAEFLHSDANTSPANLTVGKDFAYCECKFPSFRPRSTTRL